MIRRGSIQAAIREVLTDGKVHTVAGMMSVFDKLIPPEMAYKQWCRRLDAAAKCRRGRARRRRAKPDIAEWSRRGKRYVACQVVAQMVADGLIESVSGRGMGRAVRLTDKGSRDFPCDGKRMGEAIRRAILALLGYSGREVAYATVVESMIPHVPVDVALARHQKINESLRRNRTPKAGRLRQPREVSEASQIKAGASALIRQVINNMVKSGSLTVTIAGGNRTIRRRRPGDDQ